LDRRRHVSVSVKTVGVICSSCGAPTMTAATVVEGDEREDILACPCGEAWSGKRRREVVTAFVCGPGTECGEVAIGTIWASKGGC
jgi:hypothetical protein